LDLPTSLYSKPSLEGRERSSAGARIICADGLWAKNLYATNVTAETSNFQTTNASTSNADIGNFHQVTATDGLCVGAGPNDPNPVCVTKAQLAALLGAAATPTASISVSSSASSSRDASAQNP
jgi:hypothetical protein